MAVQATWTELQLDATLQWLEEEWERPSRTDHYLMALRAEVQGLFSRGSINANRLRLTFKSRNHAAMTKEEKLAWAKQVSEYGKAAAIARAGGESGVKIIRVAKPQEDPEQPTNG